MSLRWKVLTWAVAVLMAAGFSLGTVVAQDAASPEAMGECVAPELPPGTPTPMEASPAAGDMGEMEMASPMAEEATEEATTEATEEPVDSGSEADEATSATIEAGVNNIINCINSGNIEGALALLTPEALMAEFGTGNPYDVFEALEGFSIQGATISDFRTYEDGRVSARIQYMQSQYQVVGEIWYLIQDGDYWKVAGFGSFIPNVEGDQAIVEVVAAEAEAEDGTKTYSFTVKQDSDPASIPTQPETEVLIFQARNAGTEPHEVVIFKLPDGADPMGIFDGSIPEDQLEFIGANSGAPGEYFEVVLVGLPAGVYTMVCFFPAEDGAPHAVHGMVRQFEITAPAA
jgi:hypothetical protein